MQNWFHCHCIGDLSDSLYDALNDEPQCEGIKWYCKICVEEINQFTSKTKASRSRSDCSFFVVASNDSLQPALIQSDDTTDSDKSNEHPVLPTDHQQGTDTPPEPSSINLIDSTKTPIPDASPALPTIHPKPTPITKKENQPKLQRFASATTMVNVLKAKNAHCPSPKMYQLLSKWARGM